MGGSAQFPPAPTGGTPAPAYGDDPFGGPAPQLPKGPRIRDVHGRLVLITPWKVETVANRLSKEPGATQERMTADVVVLDGGTIHYGGRPEAMPPTAHTMAAEPPLRTERQYLSQAGLISQCREALAVNLRDPNAAVPRMVLGRISTGAAKGDNNPPYLLTPATPEDIALARRYVEWWVQQRAIQAIG
jgi:hypothetical protein